MRIRRPAADSTPRFAGLGRMALALIGGGLFAILAWNPRSPPIADPAGHGAAPAPPQENARPQSAIESPPNQTASIQHAMNNESNNEPYAVLNLRRIPDAERLGATRTVPEVSRTFTQKAKCDAVSTPTANSRGPPR